MMAVELQYGEFMTAFTKLVTYHMPATMFCGGCSEFLTLGEIHATSGNVPFEISLKKSVVEPRFPEML